MLIHLNADLINALDDESNQSEAVVQALQNIAQARYQGDHIISADNGVLNHIIDNALLNKTTQRVFSKINTEQSQIGSLKTKLAAYVEIKCITGTIAKSKNDSIEIIQIPLTRFERNDIIQPTFFIAENLLDCQFYLTITSWFSKRYMNGELPAKLSAVYCPGGGDTTEKLLSHHSKNQRFLTFCITDRDQKFPGAGIGETAKKCERLNLESLCHHTTLQTRSVENLISFSQINSILNLTKERKELIQRVNRLKNLFHTENWKYFHVKNGVKSIHGPHQPDTESSFWNSLATEDDLQNSETDGYLFPPISQYLLTWVVDHIEKNEPEDFCSETELLAIWKSLAKLIASWTCGSEPIRV